MKYLPLILVMCTNLCLSQNRDYDDIVVEGMVYDNFGMPVKRAILFKDSVKTFVRSNKKGKFKTKISSNTQTVSIYSKNHGIITKSYGGENTIEFNFVGPLEQLSERNLQNMGFNIIAPRKGTIDPSRFKEYSDIYQLIREMFTGVEVSGSNIVVRGSGSFGATTPLFIVDDSYVPSISYINPVELKSIELLKGEDTTMYGSRGANGVFLIYLKK